MLADRAGISRKHLSELVTGRAEGSLTAWQALLDALGIDPRRW